MRGLSEALHLKKLTKATCQEAGLKTAEKDGSHGSLKLLISRALRYFAVL